MARTRRSLLAAGVVGVATAGCLGGGGVRYPATETPREEVATAADRPVRDEQTAADPAAVDGEVAADLTEDNPELAAATRRICAEIRWFGTTYPAAIEAYSSVLRSAATTTDRARESMSPSLTSDGLRRVENAAATATQEAERRLGPHFGVDELVAEEVAYHLDVVRKFRRRDDHDRVAEELTRLSNFYGGAVAEPFVRRTMSRDPVRNRLLTWLGGGPGERVVFGLRHPRSGYAAYAYPGEPQTIVDRPVHEAERVRYDRQLGPILRGERVDRYYVVPSVLPDVDENTDDDDEIEIPRHLGRRPSQPLLIQRFESPATAADVATELLDGPVAAEGGYSFGRDVWQRVFYRVGDDVTYAYLVRAGEFLLATAPSRTAWEERVDWRGPVERSWVWTRGSGTDTPTA